MLYHRRSIRLKGYDYNQDGMYFITICTQGRKCLFGEIKDEEMILNSIGEMIEKWWCELGNKFKNIELDEYIIMPNHLHGVIFIVGADRYVCPVGADLCVCPAGNLSGYGFIEYHQGEHYRR